MGLIALGDVTLRAEDAGVACVERYSGKLVWSTLTGTSTRTIRSGDIRLRAFGDVLAVDGLRTDRIGATTATRFYDIRSGSSLNMAWSAPEGSLKLKPQDVVTLDAGFLRQEPVTSLETTHGFLIAPHDGSASVLDIDGVAVSPRIWRNIVAFVLDDDRYRSQLIWFDLQRNAVILRSSGPTWPTDGSIIAVDGSFFAVSGSDVVLVDAETRREIWRVPVEADVWHTRLVPSGDLVLALSDKVAVLRRSDGHILWTFRSGPTALGDWPVMHEDLICTPIVGGKLTPEDSTRRLLRSSRSAVVVSARGPGGRCPTWHLADGSEWARTGHAVLDRLDFAKPIGAGSVQREPCHVAVSVTSRRRLLGQHLVLTTNYRLPTPREGNDLILRLPPAVERVDVACECEH